MPRQAIRVTVAGNDSLVNTARLAACPEAGQAIREH